MFRHMFARNKRGVRGNVLLTGVSVACLLSPGATNRKSLRAKVIICKSFKNLLSNIGALEYSLPLDEDV